MAWQDELQSVSGESRLSGNKQISGSPFWKRRWASYWEYLIASLGFLITSEAFATFIRTNLSTEPNLIQHVITFISFGLPVYYMEVYIGQYTQMGVLFLRYCLPIAHGLGITFILNTLLQTIKFGYLTTDFLLYFMISLQPQLPWMDCPDEYKDICYSGLESNCTENCINSEIFPSAYIYWRYIYMDNPALNITEVEFGLPTLQRSVTLCTTWLATFLIITISYVKHRKVAAVLFYCYMTGMVILLLGILFSGGTSTGVLNLLQVQPSDFLIVDKWCHAVSNVIEVLALTEIFHLYAGSQLHPLAPSGVFTVMTAMIVFSIVFIKSMITSIIASLVEYKIHGDMFNKAYFHMESNVDSITILFILIPQGLGYLSLPQMWSAIFFGSSICVLLVNQMSHLVAIQITITDIYPNFGKFRTYLLGILCVISSLVGLSILPDTLYILATHFIEVALFNATSVSAFMFCLLIFWVYSVIRLSDDIHFMTGYQPTKFWKICWYTCPAILSVTVFNTISGYLSNANILININFITTFLVLSPFLFLIIFQIFTAIKRRSLISLIQPDEQWGPPDPEERHLRRMFNPRKETRYSTHRNICHHQCLLDSKVLKNISQQETYCRKKYLRDFYDDRSKV